MGVGGGMGARVGRIVGRLWVAGTAVCAVLLALGFRFGDERTWWIELLRYVPYLAWLAPALLALLASAWLRWPWRWVATAALACVLGPVMGLSLGGLNPPAQQSGTALRLMTYNIKSYRAEWQGGGYEEIADEISRQAPDVLVMQDAPHLNRPRGMHEAVAQALAPYPHRFGAGQYVVASKRPLRDCRAADLAAAGGNLPYVRCTVALEGVSLTLLTTHTLTPRQGLNATRHEALDGVDDWQANFRVRLDQARQLARELEGLPRPLVVAGDLNAPEHSPVVQVLLERGLRDAFAAGGLGWGYTIGHALKPHLSFVRIDHILASPEVGVQRAWAGGRRGSEHRPVVADLNVPR